MDICDTHQLKLHLGCGARYIPGFIHIDIQRSPCVDIIADISSLDFLKSDSADLIYACHVLEHFGRWECQDVLAEWARVLKPGGVLRLSVPDFKSCADIYYEKGLENGLSGLIGLIAGGQRDETDFHKMIFDEELLSTTLSAAGLRNIRRWDWRTTEHAHVDDYSQAHLPHLDKEHGKLMSLNLEAEK